MNIEWPDILAHFQSGDSLQPLVGVSRLVVDSLDDEQICIRQRLWRACFTKADLMTANSVLASSRVDVTPLQFAELLRAHYTSGSDITTECTRTPNLAAVVLYNLGALGSAPSPR